MVLEHLYVWLSLLLAAFGAGVLNAIAGGGSFLTLPALIWSGVNPVAAGVTSAVVVAPGYLGSVLGYRHELVKQPVSILYTDIFSCAVGGLIGSVLLLFTQDRLFTQIVPWLMIFATVLFIIGPSISRYFGVLNTGSVESCDNKNTKLAAQHFNICRPVLLLLVSVYGGYFNGGLGIMLMAAYFLVGQVHLHSINALKNLDSLVLAIVSVFTFVAADAVLWGYALPMMIAAMAGGVAGVRLARWLPLFWVRTIVIGTGITMSLLLWYKA